MSGINWEAEYRRIAREEAEAVVARAQLHSREWFTAEQAAAYLGLSVGTLYNAVSSGELPRSGEKGTRLLFSKEHLDAYVGTKSTGLTRAGASLT